MKDVIQGDKFEAVGQLSYAPSQRSSGDYSQYPNTFTVEGSLEYNPCVVYTHSFYVRQLFELIENINHQYIVVTHNCDMNIDFTPPSNVIKWFTQNINIWDERVEAIPIGLENDRWFKDIHKLSKMQAKLQEQRKHKNLVYMNHSIGTNPIKRQAPYDALKDKSWVTTCLGSNGVKFDDYLDNIYNHKFVVCPEGNGIDTHRFWECQYMGTIPIVRDSIIAEKLYSYFPCVICRDWSEITEERLKREFCQINDIRRWFDGDKKMLTFEYWKNKIYSWT